MTRGAGCPAERDAVEAEAASSRCPASRGRYAAAGTADLGRGVRVFAEPGRYPGSDAGSSGLEYSLNVELDAEGLRDEDAAAFEGHVPGEAPLFAIDLADRGEGSLGVTEWVDCLTVEGQSEGDWSGHPSDSQITGENPAVVLRRDACRLEDDLRVVLGVEEVWRPEVVVRSAVPVVTVAALATTSTVDWVGSSATTMVPERSSNVPRPWSP